MEAKLWGGFSRYALNDLEALKRSPRAESVEISHAAWSLARWFMVERDYERAYDNIVFMRCANRDGRAHMGQVLLEAECLVRRGERESARDLLLGMLKRRPDDSSLCLAMANTYGPLNGPGTPEADAFRLAWINRVYAGKNLLPLSQAHPDESLAIDNLTGAHRTAVSNVADARVSVIMPAYNGAETLAFALRSLMEQSWQNLEVIVVDDCSVDESFAIAEEFAKRDGRVKAVRQETNQGAYVARNRGLTLATGKFVTTHDADDWSHPQKIEKQVEYVEKEGAIASLTAWVRATPHLWITGSFWPTLTLPHKNSSSLLVPREVLKALGGWHEVRTSADTELIWRLQRYSGSKAKVLLDQIPLSFALVKPSSLSKSAATQIKTIHHGVRRVYRESAAYWHSTVETADQLNLLKFANGAIPAPYSIASERRANTTADLLFITDFNIGAGAGASSLEYLRAASSCGLTVAVFQWRRYDLDVRRPLNAAIWQMAKEGKVRVVAPGESVRASTVIVNYPPILQHAIDLCPKLEFDSFVVLVNQTAARLTSGDDIQYDPAQVRKNLIELFGTQGIWAPISDRVRRIMEQDERYPEPHVETWMPLIDTAQWCDQQPRWRGGTCDRPVVGRHGRDHYTKWPSTPGALKSAYCADKNCDVVIMGGVKHALKVIGVQPANWTVEKFGAMQPRDFLAKLDFFVHYPRENQIEAFGRAPMEAMAAGIPVILPPVFRETFGEAATYAEPDDVWTILNSLWRDEAAYLKRAEIGRDFVLKHCSYDQLPKRLSNLTEKGKILATQTTAHEQRTSACGYILFL